MKCEFCSYVYPDECGRYGCPNCLGEGMTTETNPQGPRYVAKPSTAKPGKWIVFDTLTNKVADSDKRPTKEDQAKLTANYWNLRDDAGK
jgi:hypothetical protein